MAKMILVFLILSFLIGSLIKLWQHITDKEKWSVIKIGSFSILVSVLAIIILSTIVFLF